MSSDCHMSAHRQTCNSPSISGLSPVTFSQTMSVSQLIINRCTKLRAQVAVIKGILWSAWLETIVSQQKCASFKMANISRGHINSKMTFLKFLFEVGEMLYTEKHISQVMWNENELNLWFTTDSTSNPSLSLLLLLFCWCFSSDSQVHVEATCDLKLVSLSLSLYFSMWQSISESHLTNIFFWQGFYQYTQLSRTHVLEPKQPPFTWFWEGIALATLNANPNEQLAVFYLSSTFF